MKKPTTITYLALSLTSMAVTILFCAMSLGLLPDGYRERLESRARLCETIAMQFCTLLPQEQTAAFKSLAPVLVQRNPDILSLGIRANDGSLLASTSEHTRLWRDVPVDGSLDTHVQIPIYAGEEQTARFEIGLKPVYANTWERACQQMHLPLIGFVVCLGFLAFRLYLKRAMKHLDPSSVIPERVKTVLDILSDGVVITDEKGQIVLANKAFQKVTSRPLSKLLGKKLSLLKWIQPAPRKESSDLPWNETLHEGVTHRSVPLMLENQAEPGQYLNALVSTTPILGTDGKQRGTLASFTDVTELEKTNRELVDLSRLAGMAEIATDVLHNVGNTLNSVNVTVSLLAEKLAAPHLVRLGQVADMIAAHPNDLGHFLTADSQGRHIPGYLTKTIPLLLDEQANQILAVKKLEGHVNHIKDIVKSQQSYARVTTCEVLTALSDLVESAISINSTALHQHQIHVVREYGDVNMVVVDKQRVLQILANLIRNACDALRSCAAAERQISIRLDMPEPAHLRIEVVDNGEGIVPENLTRIFQHGFTTKEEGHGFGLHSSILAAREMGGTLTAHSEGSGCGARFVLELPLDKKENVDGKVQETEPTYIGG